MLRVLNSRYCHEAALQMIQVQWPRHQLAESVPLLLEIIRVVGQPLPELRMRLCAQRILCADRSKEQTNTYEHLTDTHAEKGHTRVIEPSRGQETLPTQFLHKLCSRPLGTRVIQQPEHTSPFTKSSAPIQPIKKLHFLIYTTFSICSCCTLEYVLMRIATYLGAGERSMPPTYTKHQLLKGIYRHIDTTMSNEGLGVHTDMAIVKSKLRPMLKLPTSSEISNDIEHIPNGDDENSSSSEQQSTTYQRPLIGPRNSDQNVGRNSIGYGEMQLASVQNIIEEIQKLAEPLQITNESTFVDVGSGMGKLVYHMILATDVKESWGVEILQNRHDAARKVGPEFLETIQSLETETDPSKSPSFLAASPPHNSSAEIYTRPLSDIVDKTRFVCEDGVRFLNAHRTDFSHILMFDKVFASHTYKRLCPLLNNYISFQLLICFQKPPYLAKFGLVDVDLVGRVSIATTGSEGFSAYLYKKKEGWKPHAAVEIELDNYTEQFEDDWEEMTKQFEEEERERTNSRRRGRNPPIQQELPPPVIKKEKRQHSTKLRRKDNVPVIERYFQKDRTIDDIVKFVQPLTQAGIRRRMKNPILIDSETEEEYVDVF
ncbi:hypothetical protein BLNAU_2160 [Blattamonas nauphoetae]|uniref:Histone-lysine N-methyltransferase, H3 lysine-79 specific n=1 Tax=Blattamonas nauphoetae TaxID=2049346 RepID=A0ABQ9YG26_9EUKA|nr:hypothetical protein BLNAU_2160 [Blattamonas nauphoetae]